MAKTHFLESGFVLLALGLVGCVGAFAPGQLNSVSYTNLVVAKNKIFQRFYQAGCKSSDFRMFFGPQVKLASQKSEAQLLKNDQFKPEYIDNYFLGRAVDTDLTVALVFYEDPRQPEGKKVLGQQFVGFYCATDRQGRKQEIANMRLTAPRTMELRSTRQKNYVLQMDEVVVDYKVQVADMLPGKPVPTKPKALPIEPLYGHLDRYGLHWAKEQALANEREIKLSFNLQPSSARRTASE